MNIVQRIVLIAALFVLTPLPAKAAPLFPEQSPALRQYVEDDQEPVIGAKIASEGFLVADASQPAAPSGSVTKDVTAEGKRWFGSQPGILEAKNWSVIPYATYAPDQPIHKIGGGVFVTYRVSEYVGAGIGLDYLGQLTMPSGNVSLKYPLTPFAKVGFLPALIQEIVATPFGLAGIAVPVGGAAGQNGGVSEVTVVGTLFRIVNGLQTPIGPLNVSAGYAASKWFDTGPYSGGIHHHFLIAASISLP